VRRIEPRDADFTQPLAVRGDNWLSASDFLNRSVSTVVPGEVAVPLTAPRFAGNSRFEEMADNRRPMRYGETGQEVKIIQQALIDAGLPMPITTDGGKAPDGIFLSETRDTVKKFQRKLPDPVSDDGVIGKNTMAKLDAYFRHESPVKPPPPKVPSTGTIPLPTLPADMEKEIRRRLTEDAKLPAPKAAVVSDALMKFNLANRGLALFQIVGLVSATGGVAAFAAVTYPITFLIANMINLVNSMETSVRIAGSLGYVYGFSAWTFEHKRPGFSKQLETNLSSGHMYATPHAKDMRKYRVAWSDGVDAAFENAPLSARKLHVKGSPMSVDTFRVLLRVWGDNKPGLFSLRLSDDVAPNIRSRIEREAFSSSVKSGCFYNH
jgi:peptidoglycan hydrolase-like protein with peptidoglycan-binding domain